MYFLGEKCPQIILNDSYGESYNLNEYFDKTIRDSLHQDQFEKDGEKFTLYHIRMAEGVSKHELHFCASNREVNSYDLSQYVTDLQKRITTDEGESFYYLGYLIGNYLDANVNLNRTAFDVSNTAFYCYVIADLTDSLRLDAENAGLTPTPDNDGYYGYNQTRGAYIQVISYDKLLRDAKQRNQILFDKLFNPKVSEVLVSNLLNK